MSRTITTNGTVGIYLADPLDNPVMVAASGTISTANDYAILGSAAVVWTLTNFGKLSGGQYGMHFEGSATIANSGTVVATGTKSTGVLLQGGGSIVNGAASFLGARISGSYLGVQIAGDAGTVINLGTITSSDMPGSGAVALMQGGTVTNGSTTVTGALISGGGAAAVYIIGGTSALVTNQGTIAGQGNTATAVELWSGGTVINGSPGNSAATITAANGGVYVTGGAGTVVNDGVITGGPGASWGIYMKAGGVITNSGPAAHINGAYRSVDIRGNTGTVINSGTITGLPNFSLGVYLSAGGTITNATTASVITAAYNAIVVRGALGSVVNHGSIIGSTAVADNGSGILLQAGGHVTNGAPDNTVASIGAALNAVKVSGGTGTVVNDGTMAGSFGVYLYNGGTVTNGLAASVIKTGYFGIRVGGGTGTVLNSGTIASTGTNNYGVMLRFGGEVTNAASGRITGGARGIDLAASSTGTVSNSGVVSSVVGVTMPTTSGVITNTGTIIGTGGTAVLGGDGDDKVILQPGAVFQGKVLGLTGNNVLELAAGSTTGSISGIGTGFVNFGTIAFDAGAQWTISGDTTGLDGTISGFASGNTIEVSGVTATGSSFVGGILTLDLVGGGSATLNLPGTFTSASDFTVTNVAAGADVTVCFLAGTHIHTESGEIKVEDLVIGEHVITHSGAAKPIKWIGVGKVLATRGQRSAATPVIVRKDALGLNVPTQDLCVTKGHALYIDGVLIPVEELINHRSIFWDDRAQEVQIYHIELETHDVLIANGAPAESYRDEGNRWLFRNGNSGWNLPPQEPCAPLLTSGPVVDAIWRRLLDRAGPRPGVPMTDDPDLHLLVDGDRVEAASRLGAHIFHLPSRPSLVRIVSRAGAPAELGLARDPRLLGIAVQRIALRQGTRFRVIEAADALLEEGFHAFESDNGLRWTDGDAGVPPVLFDGFYGPTELVLHVGCTTQYVLLGEADTRAAA
jgi:hypothetical protein